MVAGATVETRFVLAFASALSLRFVALALVLAITLPAFRSAARGGPDGSEIWLDASFCHLAAKARNLLILHRCLILELLNLSLQLSLLGGSFLLRFACQTLLSSIALPSTTKLLLEVLLLLIPLVLPLVPVN